MTDKLKDLAARLRDAAPIPTGLYAEAADAILALIAENEQLQRDFTYIKQRRDALLVAMEKLARLGNGDRYGNSEGNQIAIAALNGANTP